MNTLYYGDNPEILRNREYFPSETVDLVYLDPPFNSNASYNLLFRAPEGHERHALSLIHNSEPTRLQLIS
jgi:16S rRNA G966 N2-methylase RsmD